MTVRELKHIRKQSGLNQKCFARCIGVGRHTISRWEVGQWPIPHMAEQLLLALARGSVTIKELERKPQTMGQRGGLAYTKKLTREELSAIGRLGAKARWKKKENA